MTKARIVLVAGIVLIAGASLFFILNKNQHSENVTSSEPVKKEAIVPLPQETDIVRSFFEIINEQRPSDAVNMLAPRLIADDSNKQAWAVQFNAFKSLKVKNIEPSMQSDWTENVHTYKVTLIAEMKPESANAVIPYYGFENGENIRWLSLEKVGDKWTIGGLATGP